MWRPWLITKYKKHRGPTTLDGSENFDLRRFYRHIFGGYNRWILGKFYTFANLIQKRYGRSKM